MRARGRRFRALLAIAAVSATDYRLIKTSKTGSESLDQDAPRILGVECRIGGKNARRKGGDVAETPGKRRRERNLLPLALDRGRRSPVATRSETKAVRTLLKS